ncbi:MAG: DUF559 domain-containing protein [candidate division NC10 bacterium]|nr:DUF559 domain-containing protein [candidate division NC10 bacterium]
MNRAHARALRHNPTEAERALWKHLRLRQMEGQGFRVLRFGNHQVLADVQAVKEAIREALLRT